MSDNTSSAKASLRSTIDLLRDARWLTRKRLVVWGWVLVAASLYLLVAGYRFYTARGLIAPDGEPLGQDFLNYYAGARVAAGGHAALVYDYHWFLAYERSLVGPVTPRLYAYPPIFPLFSLPLALLSYTPALVVWTLLGLAVAIWLLRRLVGWLPALMVVAAAPASAFNVLLANNGYFTAALLCGGLMLLERRPLLAGVCFGCLSYKPQMGLLLPFALAADGRWRAMAAAAATCGVLVFATLALFGAAPWVGFMHQMAPNRALLQSDRVLWNWMLTVFVAARQLGAPLGLAYAVQIASSALAVVAVVAVWRRPGAFEVKAATVIVATFLATPYSQYYDAVVLIFAAAWLGREGMRSGFLPWERLAILALLLFPIMTVPLGMRADLPLAPAVLWLVLLLLVRRAVERPVALPVAA